MKMFLNESFDSFSLAQFGDQMKGECVGWVNFLGAT